MAKSGMKADFDQLKLMSKAQVQSQIVAAGGDYHQAESKTDLIGRLLQLQGTAQPIDKIKKELKAHGIGEDGEDTTPIPIQKKRLTPEQMKKAMAKFIAKGLEFRVSKDGEQWKMRFICDQLMQNGKVVKAKRLDSGNTMIPLQVLINAATIITTVSKITIKKKDEDDFDDSFEGADDDVAA
jgi:hypothetical protein